MRVALVYPEVYDMARFKEGRKEFPPFGLLYLAAVIRHQAGYECVVMKATPDMLELDFSGFDAVGFSLASSATYGLMLAARNNSKFSGGALIMVGGVHCNFYTRESLVDFSAHVATDGESEDTILEILARADSKDFTGVNGCMWHDAHGQIRREASRPLMSSIDSLPLPARDLLPVDDFVIPDRLAGTNTRMAHVMFSRGCPFPCTFCAAGQTRIQYRSGTSARQELESLISSYSIEGFAIVDDNFIVNKNKVGEICDQVADLQLRWSALSRVDTIDEPLLGKMAKSGCIEIKYGMESGSESLLRAMRKNTKRVQIKRAVRLAAEAGIAPKVFVIHGYPGESLRTTHETMTLLDELGDDLARVSLFRFVPLPGTQVYAQASDHDLHGTHHQPGWDGNWAKFHIHHNDRHWWGTRQQWDEVEQSYRELREYVEQRWNRQG